jgi:hypothetical protein
MAYETLDDIIAANKAAGQNWFSTDTLKWWNTTLIPGVIAGHYFVTGDDPFNEGREYSVRYATDEGRIQTVGDRHRLPSQAWKAALDAARRGDAGE